ncbi:MAG: AAA family ATPase [Thermodesulfobacteriota bacterium]
MLTRVRIKGYKSLKDVEVRPADLSVLFGPNAAGKSNFLDALQLLSRLVTSRTLKDAFEPPYRGKPLESFTFGERGLRGLVEQEQLSFSIEVDVRLSAAAVEAVNRQISEMRRPALDEPEAPSTAEENPGANRLTGNGDAAKKAAVRERHLRYRIELWSQYSVGFGQGRQPVDRLDELLGEG